MFSRAQTCLSVNIRMGRAYHSYQDDCNRLSWRHPASRTDYLYKRLSPLTAVVAPAALCGKCCTRCANRSWAAPGAVTWRVTSCNIVHAACNIHNRLCAPVTRRPVTPANARASCCPRPRRWPPRLSRGRVGDRWVDSRHLAPRTFFSPQFLLDSACPPMLLFSSDGNYSAESEESRDAGQGGYGRFQHAAAGGAASVTASGGEKARGLCVSGDSAVGD
jgi:hypothetical protein